MVFLQISRKGYGLKSQRISHYTNDRCNVATPNLSQVIFLTLKKFTHNDLSFVALFTLIKLVLAHACDASMSGSV